MACAFFNQRVKLEQWEEWDNQQQWQSWEKTWGISQQEWEKTWGKGFLGILVQYRNDGLEPARQARGTQFV